MPGFEPPHRPELDDAPSFHSFDLHQSFQDARPSFERFRADLEAVSEDIRTLEHELQRFNLPIAYTLPIELAPGDRAYRTLAWEENGGRFRLLAKTVARNQAGEFELLEIHPLIEARADIRKDAYPLLPAFLRGLSRSCQVKALDLSRHDFEGGGTLIPHLTASVIRFETPKKTE